MIGGSWESEAMTTSLSRRAEMKGESKMKRPNRTAIISALLFALLVLMAGAQVSRGETEAAKASKPLNMFFDFRIGEPGSAAMHLEVIQSTYADLSKGKKTKPAAVVVFMGPSAKLISKNRAGFSAEDQKSLDAIAATITKLSKDGVKFELCLIAAQVMGVDPASVLPEIKIVPNGWVSEVNYQSQGYFLVPAY